MSTPAPAPRAILAQVVMELRLLARSPESLLVTLGIPLGILVFFSVVDILPTGTDDPVDFLVPGVLAISVMSTGLVAVAIQTAFERKYGVLKRLGTTPLSRQSYLVAKSLAVAAVLVVQTALVLLIARIALGWSAEPATLVIGLAMLLGAATFTAIGLLMAGTLRAEATLGLANALYLLLLVASGVLFDASELPTTVDVLGGLLPSGALGATLREGMVGGIDWLGLVVMTMWGVGAVVLAARHFRWDP